MKFARLSIFFIVSISLFACREAQQVDTKTSSHETSEATSSKPEVINNNKARGLNSEAADQLLEESQADKGQPTVSPQEQIDKFVKQQPIVTAGEAVKVKVEAGKDVVIDKKKVSAKTNKRTSKSKKAKTKKYKPIITFENPVLDFGEIKAGDIVTHEFIFTNTGKTPLQIKDAVPSCGCTYPSLPFLAIEPGEQGKIGIEYNSVGKNGAQNATVTINSNATEPEFELVLKGNVIGDNKKQVLIDPRDVVKKNTAIRDSLKQVEADSTGN